MFLHFTKLQKRNVNFLPFILNYLMLINEIHHIKYKILNKVLKVKFINNMDNTTLIYKYIYTFDEKNNANDVTK